ncbi:MAG: NAD(P)H-quinone oxidoreductase [Porticoccus sp.]|nr:NAD(P)H-quinone oxidoreductase [Porticoccus sp.]
MHSPSQMRCIEITEPGSHEVLKIGHRPIPKPGAQEVLIKVAAAGVNRPDVFQRQGRYPPPDGASDIPGLEVAGEIVSTGSNSNGLWKIGQPVCALLTGGGYAEYALAHQALCLPIPESLSLIQAAALPETFFTVWHNLFNRETIKPDETLLIHGGCSGIGSTAIQLASTLGHRVFATAGSDQKCQICLKLGAEIAINYHSQDFVTAIKEHTNGYGVDVILDMVGGDYVQKNISAAAFRGRIVSIAFLRGSRVEIDLMPMMLKQLMMTGSTLRSRPIEEKAQIAKALMENIWPLLENRAITPLISTTFSLDNASRAHQLMESNQHMGKIVLTVDELTTINRMVDKTAKPS